MKNKNTHESHNLRKKRFIKPGFWIGILTLAALMGFMTNRWYQDESLLNAAVPSLSLETTDGVYEIGKSEGRMLVLFFSFPG